MNPRAVATALRLLADAIEAPAEGAPVAPPSKPRKRKPSAVASVPVPDEVSAERARQVLRRKGIYVE